MGNNEQKTIQTLHGESQGILLAIAFLSGLSLLAPWVMDTQFAQAGMLLVLLLSLATYFEHKKRLSRAYLKDMGFDS